MKGASLLSRSSFSRFFNAMQLDCKTTIKNLFKKRGVRPLKKFGQNFLIDERVLQRIIMAADVREKDVILEIGPGAGVLTRELAKRAGKIIAVEKDARMVEILQETLGNSKNVDIVQGDILNKAPGKPSRELPGWLPGGSGKYKKYKIVANLPYYIVSPVIRMFLEAEKPPQEMVLMVQKEVAQRICAKPPKMNLLAVSVQFYAKPEIISYVSKRAFWPRPKVDGAIIKISKLKCQMSARHSIRLKPMAGGSKTNIRYQNLKVLSKEFFKLVKIGFSHPRKQLINNLSAGLKIDKEKMKGWLQRNKIQPSQRAETLAVENWLQLTRNFCYNKSDNKNDAQ